MVTTEFQAEQTLALSIRQDIITMISRAGSGHPGGALGMADVVAMLFSRYLHFRPNEPEWPDRDRLILSNGHICPVLYAALAEMKFFPKSELNTLRLLDSRLQGHTHRGSLPGLENTSGPLGQGLSQAVGLALSFKMRQFSQRTYCLMSDGEHQEGQTWEAYLFAAKERLGNLTVVIDRNQIQIDGPTEKILPLNPLVEKIASFNWEVLEIDGHSFEQIERALTAAASIMDRPTAIICNTIPGKGVSFMEGKYQWHGKVPNKDEATLALTELSQIEQEIKTSV